MSTTPTLDPPRGTDRAGAADAVEPDEGYFPAGRSLLREVHSERAVGLLYGQRALAIGACDPRNHVGTALHTAKPQLPFNRLAQTGKMFDTVYFGTRAEADRVLAVVRRLHEPVHGELPDPAGPYPAGTPYSAYDPELMLWTIAVQAESGMTLYETLVRTLSDAERETLWQEYRRFGELFGLRREDSPESYPAFRAYWDKRLAGDLHLTTGARRAGRAVAFHIPVAWHGRPAMEVANLIVLGTLPPRVRELYGLRFDRAQQAAFQVAIHATRALLPLVPDRIRHGRNAIFYDDIARLERTRYRRGAPTWHLTP